MPCWSSYAGGYRIRENVPDEAVAQITRTIALRMPNSPLVRQIAQQLGLLAGYQLPTRTGPLLQLMDVVLKRSLIERQT